MFDAELMFWLVCVSLMLLGVLALPIINRVMERKETERMFAHRRFTEYHDDMEDWC
jgi:hypothetical protein